MIYLVLLQSPFKHCALRMCWVGQDLAELLCVSHTSAAAAVLHRIPVMKLRPLAFLCTVSPWSSLLEGQFFKDMFKSFGLMA